jgi:hypothetical protein
VTKATGLPYSNYSSIFSSSQPSIPPEIMDSDTVHAANFCITAQRPLETAKTHGKWGNVIKKPMTHVHSSPKRTQGVASWPKPVRVLLSLCGSDLRSVVWWRGVSSEILAVDTGGKIYSLLFLFLFFLDTDPHLTSIMCDLYLFSVSRYELCVCGNLYTCVRVSTNLELPPTMENFKV